MQKAAESLAHTKGTVKGHRQSCLYGFAYCLWKCHLVSCPYIRRNSSNPEALCLPWLRRELASGLRNKGRDPETAVCLFFFLSGWGRLKPGQTHSSSDHDHGLLSIPFPVKLVGNWLYFIQGPSSRAFMASSSLRNSNNPKVFCLP